jgi:hypothetical protein
MTRDTKDNDVNSNNDKKEDKKKDRYVMVPFWLMERTDISDRHLRFLLVLLRHKNKETGLCYPGVALISKEMGGCGRKKVLRIIQECEDLGYIEVKRTRKEDGTNSSNLYDLKPLFHMRLKPPLTSEEQERLLEAGKLKRSTPSKEKQYGVKTIERLQMLRSEVEEFLEDRLRTEEERKAAAYNEGLTWPQPGWKPSDADLDYAFQATINKHPEVLRDDPAMFARLMVDPILQAASTPIEGWVDPYAEFRARLKKDAERQKRGEPVERTPEIPFVKSMVRTMEVAALPRWGEEGED